MGGDHKCPVCHATFTRPQHVARHMRSHTGDRPYKCQHCGDQFARSDLLARHINKCHASEKPLLDATLSNRRKGSAAASRATTSKQACDQCVQSSLPCDGANPCSKCVARKWRCTYVKFHRQTAPTGPGHQPPRPPSSSSSSLSGSIGPSRLHSHLDDFAILPPPSALPATSVPFTGSDQVFQTPFTFNPAAPTCTLNWTSADIYQLPFSMTSEADIIAKYRAQADPFRQAGPPVLSNSSSSMLPGLYSTQQHQPPSTNLYPAWGDSGTYPPLDDTKPFDGMARTHPLRSSEPTPFTLEFYGSDFTGAAYRPRSVSLDLSDSSSATSQSIPSSASSSSMHLPLPVNKICDSRSEEMQPHNAPVLQPQRSNSMPVSQSPFPNTSESSHPLPLQQPHRGEGGFSSAFGLMSIDDPNVLAGLSSDGVPFFSNFSTGGLPHSPNATPMPMRMQHAHLHQGRERVMSLGALPTPGLNKDAADTREFKDMWKTYLRSPLSGSGTVALDSSASQPLSLAQMPQSPSGQRRRKRVSSLPSVTPTVEKGHPLMMHGGVPSEVGAGGNSVRTTLHGNPEDLRSYEAAVNARSASLKLNLVPKRKVTRSTVNGSPPNGVVGACSLSSVTAGPADQDISRPSSSSSSSSLAQAFTLPHPQNHPSSHAHASASGMVKSPPMQGASISLPPMSMSGPNSSSHSHLHGHPHPYPHSVALGSSASLPFEPGSRASSVTSDGTGTGGSGSDGEAFRPSFKRYPSQTLVPASSKRVLVERGGGESKGIKVDKNGLKAEPHHRSEGRSEEVRRIERRTGTSAGVDSPGSRPIAALPERAKWA